MILKKTGLASLLLLLAVCGFACTGENAQGQEKSGENMMTDKILEGNVNAPEFPTDMMWLNTGRPLTLNEFRGKLVLLDFWTFCCINCMHVLPDLKKLEEKYPEELVVIGVHSAKFTNEKDSESIRQAILRYEIEHPVVNDHDFEIWSEYGARAWPTMVLINPKGKIIGTHSGEGIFEPFDEIIGKAIAYFDKRGELKRSPLNITRETRQANTLLSFPGKVKADPKSKRLIITDSNHNRILITDHDGKIKFVIGSGMQGAGDGDFETAAFNHPQGTYLDDDILYIADTENHLIRTADLNSRTVTTIIGTGSQARTYNIPGTGADVALNSPWDILVHDGKLYIAMAGPHQIWEADLATMHTRPYAGSAREARIDGPLLEAALAQPSGITTDGKKLYFTDSETSSIRSADLDPDGRVETIVGDDLFEYGDIDGPMSVARLQHPLGVVYQNGMLYITDTYNSKIKIIDPVKKTSTSFAGTGNAGYTDGPLKNARFSEPSGLTVLDNKLYIADANNHQIRVLDLDKKMVSTLEITGLEKLTPPKKELFTGRIVESDPVVIGAGEGVIKFTVNLPGGYKFTDQAPFYINWKSEANGIIEFGKEAGSLNMKSPDFPIEIPVSAAMGSDKLFLDAVVYFCEEGSTICLFDNIRLVVPVEVSGTGESDINLSVDASVSPI